MAGQLVKFLNLCFVFFFNDTATTEIYTLSLHDALPISRHRRGRRENPCTCTPNFVGLGAPRNFTFGVGGDYPLPRIGYRFLDTRTPRFYTYYDDVWNPESYAINPNPLDIELGDLIFVQESGNGSTCQHLQRWDGTVAVNYDYASACNA